MGVLNFDAYAALAEIEKHLPTGANRPNHSNPAPSLAPIRKVRTIRKGQEQISNSVLSDPQRYLAHLGVTGPTTYGAAAIALGWDATRAWQAEARLRADGKILINKDGQAHFKQHPEKQEARCQTLISL